MLAQGQPCIASIRFRMQNIQPPQNASLAIRSAPDQIRARVVRCRPIFGSGGDRRKTVMDAPEVWGKRAATFRLTPRPIAFAVSTLVDLCVSSTDSFAIFVDVGHPSRGSRGALPTAIYESISVTLSSTVLKCGAPADSSTIFDVSPIANV